MSSTKVSIVQIVSDTGTPLEFSYEEGGDDSLGLCRH